jgi:C-1 hydroxylase
MDAEAVRAVIDRFMQAWKQRDPAALASFHAIDGVVESPMYATRCGRPSIEDAYRAFLTSFPDATQTVEALVVEPPYAALFTTVTATHMNEFFGLPGTGRHIEFRNCQLIEMREGLMLRVRRVYDFTGLLVQVGVLRTKVMKPEVVAGP